MLEKRRRLFLGAITCAPINPYGARSQQRLLMLEVPYSMAATHLSDGRDELQCERTSGLWIDAIHLGRDDGSIHGRGALSAAVRSANSRDFRPRAAIIADRGTNRFLSQKCLSEHTLKEKCPKLGPRARRTDGFDFGVQAAVPPAFAGDARPIASGVIHDFRPSSAAGKGVPLRQPQENPPPRPPAIVEMKEELPSFLPDATRAFPPDIYIDFQTDKAWKRSGNQVSACR